MIRLKVIYNIDNITGVQNKNMPIYFAIIDIAAPYNPYYIWLNAAMVVYSDEVSFIEDTKITVNALVIKSFALSHSSLPTFITVGRR